ncbi:MAG: hypothetical protein IKJ16_02595 [Agathobacter sp.]|nr:hypothetical protein [Agathobacter sp.]
MLFGGDSLKKWKKEWKKAGVDMRFVKKWQKTFNKVKKKAALLEVQYTKAGQELQQVYSILKEMEATLISMKEDFSNTSYKSALNRYAKEIKRFQGHFNQEFLIGVEDRDFHLTYQTLLKLCNKGFKEQQDVLILQSEVENILAVTAEALEKEWPDFRKMAYFYLNRTDKDISDLPHMDKLEKVNKIYETEFLEPMKQVLAVAFGEEKAKYSLEVDVWN